MKGRQMRLFSKSLVGSLSVLTIGTLLLTGCGSTEDSASTADEAVTTSDAQSSTDVNEEVEPESEEGQLEEEEVIEEPAGATFADGVLTLDDRTITITDVRTIAAGEAGNEYGDSPVIAFWYEVTNLSGEEMDATTSWIMSFSAYQDNDPNVLNELGIASLPDSQYLDTQTANIKQGGTVANAVAYELSDETTPVDLVASDALGFTEIGYATYTLN